MKRKILLIEESLTVQKVVALTFNRNLYSISYAKSCSEAKQLFGTVHFDCVIISDQVSDFDAHSFSLEKICCETSPVVLITTQEIPRNPKFSAVIRKPFSPSLLQKTVEELFSTEEKTKLYETPINEKIVHGEEKLQENFNKAFNDEAKLVKETLMPEEKNKSLFTIPPPPEKEESLSNVINDSDEKNLWEVSDNKEVKEGDDLDKPSAPVSSSKDDKNHEASLKKESLIMDIEESLAYKTTLENKVEAKIAESNLENLVNQALDRLLPPIVERLVKEKLDELMKEETV